MIAGAGAEGCFLIPFTLSMEIVGIKVMLVFFMEDRERKKLKHCLFAGSTIYIFFGINIIFFSSS